MGRRSNFNKKERDFYPTPAKAVPPLTEFLEETFTYAEPCFGEGDLIQHLNHFGGIKNAEGEFHWQCKYANDIVYGVDALNLTKEDVRDCDYIITNPPWTRSILHPLIEHFRHLRPTWLLLDLPWSATRQAAQYLKYCSDIVVIGRLCWIPGTKQTGKDDSAWYKFVDHEVDTIFHNLRSK